MSDPPADTSSQIFDHKSNRTALLIVDMINRFDFPGADLLEPKAVAASAAIGRLRSQMRAGGCPTIYVNDNFGEWHSEKSRLVENARNAVTDRVSPDAEDYFVIKPQFSGFYSTNLPVLLPRLGVTQLILTGIQTDICVLFTAADAHMRDYKLWVPADAVASERDARGRWALDIMRESMGAETRATSDLDIAAWCVADREKD